MREMKLQDLKAKTPAELVSFAEELGRSLGLEVLEFHFPHTGMP
jgi:hypothetical protein